MASKVMELKAFEKLEELMNEVTRLQQCILYATEGHSAETSRLNEMFSLAFPKAARMPSYGRKNGYQQWGDDEKHYMKKLSEFIAFCGAIERENTNTIMFRPDLTQNEVVSQHTRFPDEPEVSTYQS